MPTPTLTNAVAEARRILAHDYAGDTARELADLRASLTRITSELGGAQ